MIHTYIKTRICKPVHFKLYEYNIYLFIGWFKLLTIKTFIPYSCEIPELHVRKYGTSRDLVWKIRCEESEKCLTALA